MTPSASTMKCFGAIPGTSQREAISGRLAPAIKNVQPR